MILRCLQILTFIFAATFEVKVRAAEVISLAQDQKPIEEPTNCLDSGEICAVKTNSGKKFSIELSGATTTMGSSTSIIRSRKNQISFVGGVLLVTANDQFYVESEFGKVIFKEGEALLVKEPNKLVVNVIKGEVFIQPRGKSEMIQVDPGFENSIGAVEKTGVAHTEIATAVNLTDHAILWSSLYSGHKSEFQKELRTFAGVWKVANQKAAVIHADLAKRRIASLEQDYQRRQKELKKRQVYEGELRALFRKKALDQ